MSSDQLSRAQESNLQQFAKSGGTCGPSGCPRVAYSCPRKAPAATGNTASTCVRNSSCGRSSQGPCAKKVPSGESSAAPSESVSDMVIRRINNYFGGSAPVVGACRPCSRSGNQTKPSGQITQPNRCKGDSEDLLYQTRRYTPCGVIDSSCNQSGKETRSCAKSASRATTQSGSCKGNKGDTLCQARQYKPCSDVDKPCNRVSPWTTSGQCGRKDASCKQTGKSNDKDNLPIGASVRIAAIPDRCEKARRGTNRILAVVLCVDDSGRYKLGTKKGVIGRMFSRDELEPCGRSLLSKDEIPRNTINMLEASTLAF